MLGDEIEAGLVGMAITFVVYYAASVPLAFLVDKTAPKIGLRKALNPAHSSLSQQWKFLTFILGLKFLRFEDPRIKVAGAVSFTCFFLMMALLVLVNHRAIGW